MKSGSALICLRIAVFLVLTGMLLAGTGCGSNAHLAVTITETGTPIATVTPIATPKPTPVASPSTTATPTVSTTPTATPTAVGAVALWVENAEGNYVMEFKGDTLTTPGASVPSPNAANMSANISPDPAGITFDASNNQWVSVCGSQTPVNHGSITEFKAATVAELPTNSAPAADVILKDDGTGNLVNCPWTMTFDAIGNLWVANSNEFGVLNPGQGFVTKYLPGQLGSSGSPTPNITLTDPTEFVSPTGVIFDASGNLFVSDFGPSQTPFPNIGGPGKIWVFKAATVAALVPGTNKHKSDASLSDPSTVTPVNGAFDHNGNLWVADCDANFVAGTMGELYMFPKATLTTGATSAKTIFQTTSITTPNGVENTIECPGGIAFDAQGNLWYTNFFNEFGNGGVGEFLQSQLSATGTSSPTPNIFLDGDSARTNFNAPIGLTFGPGV